ncbi:hypothetical protein ACIOWE_26895 [Pseudomonas sp. NPDC087598]|uniref:hypothetical protein n=1 Tax=Pseudomonas sp. NPDC087598 TaxID=3364440 RepID=UPI0037F8BE76
MTQSITFQRKHQSYSGLSIKAPMLCEIRFRSGVAQSNRERHDDHASESEIEIHKVFILKPFESGAILNRLNAKKKFAVVIPMIETIDTRRFVFVRGFR